MNKTKYMVARLSLNTDYKWVVDVYAEFPEEDGTERKWDSLDFDTLEDALDYLDYQVTKHEKVYEDLMLSGEGKQSVIN